MFRSHTMPFTATIFQGPPTPSSLSEHPIFTWYARYAHDFDYAKTTTLPTRYYSSTAEIIHPDGSSTSGGRQIWYYYITLYGQFERISHDIISATALTDDQNGNHTLIIEVLTSLYPKGGKNKVSLPQGFVYEIRKAESGFGTDGLQIRKLRCYFDKGLLQSAASS